MASLTGSSALLGITTGRTLSPRKQNIQLWIGFRCESKNFKCLSPGGPLNGKYDLGLP